MFDSAEKILIFRTALHSWRREWRGEAGRRCPGRSWACLHWPLPWSFCHSRQYRIPCIHSLASSLSLQRSPSWWASSASFISPGPAGTWKAPRWSGSSPPSYLPPCPAPVSLGEEEQGHYRRGYLPASGPSMSYPQFATVRPMAASVVLMFRSEPDGPHDQCSGSSHMAIVDST